MKRIAQHSILDSLINDGVVLTKETRHYVAHHEKADRLEFKMNHCLVVGYHQSRVVSRMISTMTWLMAIKALHDGEFPSNQITHDQYSPSTDVGCISDYGEDDETLTVGLRDLLKRSRNFHSRISRLNANVQQRINAEKVPIFSSKLG